MPAETSSHSHAFTLVYVDQSLIVLNKPSGLLAVPGRGQDKQDCLSARVQSCFPDALVVHRLDMATSGLLVMARGAGVQRTMSSAFAQRSVEKRYIAVVTGQVGETPNEARIINLPIAIDWPNRPRRVIAPQAGQPSLTRLRTLAFDESRNTTRVELEPLTGRTHQLRVHLLAIGHPILGDLLYAPFGVQAMAGRLQLHATELTFAHPERTTLMRFTCPADF
jgi:tRNA pseudouridine32 synthase/23S rRNA pseudouridine746 synthase